MEHKSLDNAELSDDVLAVRHSVRLASSTQKRLSFDFVAPTKRCKSEHHAPIDMARKKLCKEKLAALQQLCVEHEKHLAEEYFLSQKNHVLDFDIWRKNLPTAYQTHLKDNEFEIGDLEEEFAIFDEPATPSTVVRQQSTSDALELSPIVPAVVQEAEMTTVSSMIDFSNFASTSVPNTPIVIKAEIPNDQQRVSSINMQQSYVSSTLHNGEMSPNIAQTPESITTPSTSLQIDTRIVPTDDYSSSVESSDHKPRLAIDNKFSRQQDANVERVAKQEANILRRIAELRREGLWSTAKMPKCMDPPRSKTHWDYVLEEMQWMAVDFEQERKWKRNASKKLVIAVARQKRELDDRERKIEIDKEKELKRVASFMAREIRQFWNSVEKVVEYKTENIIEAKKKRALDKHLDFIVNQTEKYSNLISEGLNKTVMTGHGDSEYEDENSSEDDESTIARAEIDIDQKQVSEEIALLQKESEMDVDDLISSLPPGYLENFGVSSGTQSASIADSSELAELKPENDDSRSLTEESEADNKPGTSGVDESVNFEIFRLESSNSEERQKQLTNIAEAAEKLLPRGFTLDSVNVVTRQPFLLKHELREYQRVGLDWLVTLYDKKLNGILADEMGLGKTIQTIALLAYLACEKSNWGPHLIVVPTTVLLNWEMECKKWCPAFKILTYYGSIKERKEKRKGWAKKNAFHICITSYTLVLQDHRKFRGKHWEYLILDEAQNIKNFKSLRWQMLLNFRTERRLLLTGTPLQNSLMELWSLMHFLMPHIFGSHKDFREWFSNPLTGMIEGSQEYNEQTVKRLHKVLRPFLLRRLKSEVEKQLPKKFEHVIVCQLSKRQRFLYEDFMSRGSTKNLLSSGNVMSVMNVLMQLRKVCNHPFLFEPRPIFSPYIVKPIDYTTAGRVVDILEFDILKNLQRHNLLERENSNRFIYQSLCELSRIDKLTKTALEEEPSVPVVVGFSLNEFYTNAAIGRGHKSDRVTKRLQFVLPTNVAGNMDLRQPFFLQMGTPSGIKFIPIKLDSQTTQNANSMTQQNATTSSATAVDSQSKSNDASSQTKEPIVLKLIPQNSAQRHQQVMTFQAAPTVQSGVNLLSSNVPKLLNQIWPDSKKHCDLPVTDKKKLNQMFPGMAVITTKTHLHPKMTDNANYRTTTTNFVPSIGGTGHRVTVHDIIPRTPTVCVFDPKKAQENSQTSKASVPPTSPPKRSLASVVSIISQHVDEAKPSTSCNMGSAFELTSLKRKKVERMVSNFLRVLTENQRRCKETKPVYGENLRRLCCISKTSPLDQFVTSLEQRFESSKPILDRFIVAVPAVKSTSPIALNISKMIDADRKSQENLLNCLKQALHPLLDLLEPVASSLAIQFPELRLIEYDCGKLQSLSMLLRRLKIDGHRCLIFTQMARMLDILESFLSYHGHTYLRLDGATQIEHRQILMERFNQDRRIFCFILSTRSGGIGINLTGADTVIFYDSDWNPTMDAQAQDRCHRIGQTRDVHIYRLISEKTVEENILKKSMQKRKLGEIAIEEGEFTSEFFKKPIENITIIDTYPTSDSNIADIFELVNADTSKLPSLSQQELEQVMTRVEDDERDVAAANVARAEAVANMDEFNEESPQPSTSLNADDDASTIDPDMLKIDQEMKHLMEQLKPVERYAVRYIEAIVEPDRLDEVRQTEREIESHKRKWEQLQETSAVENERKRRRIRDEEFDLTYEIDDSTSQMISLDDESDILPIWYPPTPPPSDLEDSAADFDPYFEPTMGFLYERTPMTESELPPLYVESQIADRSPFKSPKRDENRTSSSAGDNGISTPQNLTSSSSLTQNPTPQKFADVKRLETRLRTPVSPAQAVRPASGEQSPQIGHPSTKSNPPLTTAAAKQPKPSRRPGTPPVGVTENESADVVYEWNLLEDYSLFNAVTKVQHAHQSSVIVGNNEGHGINWDLVSECVAASCGRYRSPKQCHRRYEMVILPREEGRAVLADHPPVISTKKSRKLDAEMAASKKFRIRTIYQFQNEGQSFMNSFVGQRFRNSTGLRIKRSLLNKRASYGICRSGAEPKHRGAGWSSLPTNFQANLIDPFKMVELYEERLRVEEKRKQLHQQQLAEQAAATISTRSLTAPGAITIVQQPQQMAGSSTAGLPSGATVIPFQLPIGQQQLQGQQLSFMVNSQGGRLLTRPVQQSTYQQVNQSIIQSNVDSGPFASRQTNHPMPVNVQTTTVYRQMHPQTFKMQQTPPGTPNPVAAYQASVSSAAAMANYQTGAGGRTYIEIPASSSGVVVQSAVGGSAQQLTNQQTQVVSQPPLDFTSLIKQQPQQRVAVSGATKQKIQFGNGSFLVSADITKGSSTGSQIATVLPAGQISQARFSGTPVRTQVQLSNAGANIHQHNIRRNSPLPRGVGMQPVNARSSMTPSASVHLISNTGRLMTGSQANSSVAASRIQMTPAVNSPAPYLPPNVTTASQQAPQPNQSSSKAAANNRNSIPSVSNILPHSAPNRVENLPGGPTIIIHHHPYPPSTAP